MVEPSDTNYIYAPPYYEITLSDSSINTMYFLATPDSASHIETPQTSEDISMDCFPNPASDYIYLNLHDLSSNETIDISIISLKGEYVYYEKVKNFQTDFKKKIELRDFQKGVYFITVYYKNNKLTNKIIIH